MPCRPGGTSMGTRVIAAPVESSAFGSRARPPNAVASSPVVAPGGPSGMACPSCRHTERRKDTTIETASRRRAMLSMRVRGSSRRAARGDRVDAGVRAVRVADRVVASQRPVTRFVRATRAVAGGWCGPMHVHHLPSPRARSYSRLAMKTFGRCMSVIAALAVAPAFRRLRTDLVSVYSAYRASLRSRLPEVLVTTLVVAEDRGFRRHAGVEFVPAVWMLSRLAAARRPGRRASLEQRLVRILTGRPPRRIGAGVRELLLASLVTRVIPKEDVAGAYLFVAYFGWRMNGIREACGRLGFS